MQLLIYASPTNTIGRDLKKRIQSLELEIPSTYCATLVALKKHVRQPMGLSPICVLILSEERELTELICMRDLLRDMRLIVILPSTEQPGSAHTRAHMLRPRFISDADGDLGDVTAVICKMKESVRPPAFQTVD
jgi:hypothetical protein